MRFIALEEQLRGRAGLRGIDTVDGAWIACCDIQPSGWVEGQGPDVS